MKDYLFDFKHCHHHEFWGLGLGVSHVPSRGRGVTSLKDSELLAQFISTFGAVKYG